MSRRILLTLVGVFTLCSLAAGCGKSQTTKTSAAVSSTSGTVGTTQPSTGICALIASLGHAPDSDKTRIIRQIAAEPQAASFAPLLTFYANLRDAGRGVPVSTVPGDLKIGDPQIQQQNDLFTAFAEKTCGMAPALLK